MLSPSKVALLLVGLAALGVSNPSGAVAPRVSITGISNAIVTLAISGEPEARLGAEASSDLATWVEIASAPAPDGQVVFEHRVPGESGPLFFRGVAREPEPPPPPPVPIVLPIEVLGAGPTNREVAVRLPQGQGVETATNLVFEARVFGLDYAGKATFEINDGFCLALSNKNVRLPARQAAYGGIGGMYSTLTVRLPLPAGALRPGENRIRFKFNGTDGDSIGYRVLRFNVFRNGAALVSTNHFVEDDPAAWTAPVVDPSDVAQGRKLWKSRELVKSSLPRAPLIRARCADCHAEDGYDLKYFNYSNLSIVERSKFHGMTDEEGRKVAAYIRSLEVPAPGRPWDPPYQPGPGLDAKPVSHWAAGAGIDAVLEEDVDTYRYLFPGGAVPLEWDLTKETNAREIQVAMELPVWNLWLPKIHPLDYYGDLFEGGKIESEYRKAAAALGPARAKGAVAAARAFDGFRAEMSSGFANAFTDARGLLNEPAAVGAEPTRIQSLGRYSIFQWRLVKTWELMRKHEMEGLGTVLRDAGLYPNPPSTAKDVPDRTWLGDGFAFRTAPHMAHLPGKGHGIRDGTNLTWSYVSLAWYYVQLILDDNHRRGDGATHWPYMTAFTSLNGNGQVFGAMRAVTLFKNMEAHYNRYRLTDRTAFPWSLVNVRMYLLSPGSPAALRTWSQTPPEIWRPMVASYLRGYLKRTKEFPVEDYRLATPESFSGPGVASLGVHSDSQYLLPQWYWSFKDFKQRGVDPEVINEAVDFAQKLWPGFAADWEKLRTPMPSPSP